MKKCSEQGSYSVLKVWEMFNLIRYVFMVRNTLDFKYNPLKQKQVYVAILLI